MILTQIPRRTRQRWAKKIQKESRQMESSMSSANCADDIQPEAMEIDNAYEYNEEYFHDSLYESKELEYDSADAENYSVRSISSESSSVTEELDQLNRSDIELEIDDESEDESVYEILDMVRSKLYDGSELSDEEGVFLVMEYYINFKLSKAALQGLLKIFKIMLPKNNNLPTSNYKMFKFIRQFAPQLNEKKPLLLQGLFILLQRK